MPELFARTCAQALQAFMPIAVAFVWVRSIRRSDLTRASIAGVCAAVPITIAAAWQFQQSAHQAIWEAATTIAVAVIGGIAMRRLLASGNRGRVSADGPVARCVVAAAIAIVIARETMLIGATFTAAAIQMRSLDATVAIVSAAAVAVFVAVAWIVAGRYAPPRTLADGTLLFAGTFVPYALFCALHKSAEARFFPWSEIVDTATEAYGPDSLFGRDVAYMLAAMPFVAAIWTAVVRVAARVRMMGPRLARASRIAAVAAGALVSACAAIVLAATSGVSILPSTDSRSEAAADVTLAAGGSPRVIYISTAVDAKYRQVNVAPLQANGAAIASAVGTDLRCERVAFAAGQGICLQADRGLFTTYTAVIVDERLRARSSFKLDGSPSRTRISPDGRVGAITVFLTGQAHGYASSSFSTKTTLVDMAGGNVIGDLEQFSTWKDGARFSAADFNFWGVTFARDSNIFYATLQTAAGMPPVRGNAAQRARTYLVRGELGLRRLTVLHENVECPSLSPDNRVIAYKKRVSWDLNPWRLYVLDVATMAETPIEAEARSIDDQIEWLDDARVLYAAPRSADSATTDVYVASIAGRQTARVFIPAAQSPIVVR